MSVDQGPGVEVLEDPLTTGAPLSPQGARAKIFAVDIARGRECGLRIMWACCSGPRQLPREYGGSSAGPGFFFAPGPAPETAHRLRQGQEPAGEDFSHRDLSRGTGYPYVNFLLTEESVVGIIAGAAILLLAFHLISARGSAGHSRRRPGWAHW